MRTNIQESKLMLRRRIRILLDKMTTVQRAAASVQACALLGQQAVWQRARSIAFYAPLPEELDVWALVLESLAARRIVALPRFDRSENRYVACQIQDLDGDIVSGQLGIREPASHCAVIGWNRLDLVLVPGVAFDLRGRRLGRGRGFYDEMLGHMSGTTCGVAFDEQIVEDIPVEPHDLRVNGLLTPSRWVGF